MKKKFSLASNSVFVLPVSGEKLVVELNFIVYVDRSAFGFSDQKKLLKKPIRIRSSSAEKFFRIKGLDNVFSIRNNIRHLVGDL